MPKVGGLMRYLLITLGSHGDVHPFVGLALALKRRGHGVALMTSGYFAELIRRTGVECIELGSAEEFEKVSDNPDLWNPRKALKVIAESMAGYLPRMYEKILAYIQEHPGTVMVGSTLAFAARIVQEKKGTPLITVHLSPGTIRSVYDTMKIPGVPLGKGAPIWVKKAFFAVADWVAIDRHMGAGINRFRRELGLQPVKKIVAEWWHSPQGVIGLWPEFFAPPQIDWPGKVKLVGFPLWDEAGVTQISEELQTFLGSGDPPVAFTPGSAMMHGEEFFAKAIAACEMAGMRGILLTRHRRHLPARLADNVRHFDYAPFSWLLPRCALTVHHGGIGTTAQALASGRPQVVTPFSFDQFDNAERSQRLGSAWVLAGSSFTARRLAATLKRAQEEADTGNLADIADKIHRRHGLKAACDAIEAFSGA